MDNKIAIVALKYFKWCRLYIYFIYIFQKKGRKKIKRIPNVALNVAFNWKYGKHTDLYTGRFASGSFARSRRLRKYDRSISIISNELALNFQKVERKAIQDNQNESSGSVNRWNAKERKRENEMKWEREKGKRERSNPLIIRARDATRFHELVTRRTRCIFDNCNIRSSGEATR